MLHTVSVAISHTLDTVCVATCVPMYAALRIHISTEVKRALDAVGGFRTEHRGLVDVKVCFMFIKISCYNYICNSF
jgi:hypothetical protein